MFWTNKDQLKNKASPTSYNPEILNGKVSHNSSFSLQFGTKSERFPEEFPNLNALPGPGSYQISWDIKWKPSKISKGLNTSWMSVSLSDKIVVDDDKLMIIT